MININYLPAPMMTSTALFAQFPKEEARAAGCITVELYMHTKTRVSISLRHTDKSIGVNYAPAGSENLKFDIETGTNWFSGNTSSKKYFKLSKKQCLPQLEQHLKNIVKDVFSLTEDDKFEINVWMNSAYRTIRNASPQPVQEAA